MPSTAEIVARLTLNGEKFSSETARLFGSLETAAKEAGQQVEGQLAGRLEKIKEIAARGVSIDIQGLKEGAAGAAATAASLKTVADAAERVAAKAGGLDTALNAQAVAARNAASASELRAAKLVEEARAMDLLQAELGQTVTAQGRMQAATRATGGNLGMAGQQIQDFAIQVQNGQNPIAAFSQQMSQMGFALQGAGGWLGKVGNVLNGPWGAALVLGGLVAASFSDQIFGATDKVKEQVKALEDQERKTRDAARAQEAFGKTAEGAAASIRKVSDELDRQNRSLGDNIALARQKLQNDLALVRSGQGDVGGQLRTARADMDRLRSKAAELASGSGFVGENPAAELASIGAQVKAAEDRVRSLTAQLEGLNSARSAGERALRQVDLPLINRDIEEGMTAEGRAARALRIELERLTAARSAGTISAAEYRQQSRKARETNAAELERLRKERPSRSSGADNDATRFINPVGGGRVTGEWNEQRTGRRHAGIDLAVPVGTAVKAAAAGVIIETGNDPGGYGNFVIIDHGRGTTTRYAHLLSIGKGKGASVDQGDVIGASGGARGAPGSGNSRGAHLHYEVRQGGRPVDPRKGSFATDSANVQDAAADRAETALKRQQEIRERLLAQADRQLSIEVETARYFGLSVAGLDKQAESERAIAAIRRESAEWLKQATEGMDPKQAEEFLAAESKVGDAFKEKLAAVDQQAEAYALLLSQSGDLSLLTDGQKSAILQQNDALAAQLEGAKALAKTAEERKMLEEAIVRLQGKLSAAPDQRGEGYGPKQQAFEEASRLWDEHHAQQQDSIQRLANFYEDAFNSGGKSIWKQFKDEGKRALAVVAAQYTLALLSGQKVSLGGLLSQMGAVSGAGGGGGGLSGLLGMFGGTGGALGGLNLFGGGSGNSVSANIPMPNASFGSIFKGGMGEGGALGSGPGGGIPGVGGFGGAGGGLAIGMLSSAAVGAITGRNNTGSSIGGALGGVAGSFIPIPGGQIIGSVIGSFIGGLIGKPKAKYGTASLSSIDGSAMLNSRGDGFASAATGAGKSVQDALSQIIEQLGGTAGGFKVSIGQYKDSWRVNTNGYTGGSLNSKGFSGVGLHDFGQDQEAAIRFAISDALSDGAVKGISDASLRILKAGGDLDASLKKALAIESIPKRLKQMTDPVGYAIDELNKKWAETIAALKEGGASVEQMADAQKLYKLELAETKASARDATEGLKAFLKSIDFGSASPYSLRDQRAKAEAELAPYLASIAKGEAIDTGKFTDAAQAMLELERQLFGSTGQYFDSVDKIRNATNAAISSIEIAAPSRGPDADPFAEATATNTATANELLDQLSKQTATSIALLQSIAGNLGSAGGGFVGGSSRQFAQVQLT